jgi:hypothetical protein
MFSASVISTDQVCTVPCKQGADPAQPPKSQSVEEMEAKPMLVPVEQEADGVERERRADIEQKPGRQVPT